MKSSWAVCLRRLDVALVDGLTIINLCLLFPLYYCLDAAFNWLIICELSLGSIQPLFWRQLNIHIWRRWNIARIKRSKSKYVQNWTKNSYKWRKYLKIKYMLKMHKFHQSQYFYIKSLSYRRWWWTELEREYPSA